MDGLGRYDHCLKQLITITIINFSFFFLHPPQTHNYYIYIVLSTLNNSCALYTVSFMSRQDLPVQESRGSLSLAVDSWSVRGDRPGVGGAEN